MGKRNSMEGQASSVKQKWKAIQGSRPQCGLPTLLISARGYRGLLQVASVQINSLRRWRGARHAGE
jgi:hypothetical protein